MRITAASIPTLSMSNLHSFSSLGRIYALFAFNYHLCSVYLHVQFSIMLRHPIYIVSVVATIRASSYYSFEIIPIEIYVTSKPLFAWKPRRVQSQFVVSRWSPSKMPPNIRRICAMSALPPRGLPPPFCTSMARSSSGMAQLRLILWQGVGHFGADTVSSLTGKFEHHTEATASV
jgi:hypothetical protein